MKSLRSIILFTHYEDNEHKKEIEGKDEIIDELLRTAKNTNKTVKIILDKLEVTLMMKV